MQFAGVGTDYPVLKEIREMYKKGGKPAPKEMASTVYYNRGVVWAAVQVEAVRNALKAKPDGRITGEDVKKGDRKSTRLNSSHSQISYAVFCLKKKKKRFAHSEPSL